MPKKTSGPALAKEAEALRNMGLQLLELQNLGLGDLRARYLELFGVAPKSKNLPFLRKKLAFRLQERVEGGLSPEAKSRLEELAPAELPARMPEPIPLFRSSDLRARDSRLPPAGTTLMRHYHGCAYEVEVLDQGFRYRGRMYASLSTLAKEITGTPWNGFAFFGLGKVASHGK